MDVDEEDAEGGSSQRLKRVPDYGIEVDFEVLSGDEKEVSGAARALRVLETFLIFRKRRLRTLLGKRSPNSMRPLQNLTPRSSG